VHAARAACAAFRANYADTVRWEYARPGPTWYNYTKQCPGPTAVQRRVGVLQVQYLCRGFNDHLDYGTLSMTYGSLWHNSTEENVYAHMTPTTALEIGEGFVIGRERTVTKVSGLYEAPLPAATAAGAGAGVSRVVRSATVHRYVECLKSQVEEHPAPRVHLQIGRDETAVIVWNH
jgi:hypothetical protein